jgi:hypothetical protein
MNLIGNLLQSVQSPVLFKQEIVRNCRDPIISRNVSCLSEKGDFANI